MYHIFSASEATAAATRGKGHGSALNASGARRSRRAKSTLRACEHCRRRKVRCDGQLPCEPCKFHERKFKCRYRSPDASESASALAVSATSRHHGAHHPSPGPSLTPVQPPAVTLGVPHEPRTPVVSNASPAKLRRLEHLHSFPDEAPTAPTPNGIVTGQPLTSQVQDDVNALSMSATQSFSYLGISSVRALLRVIA